MHKKYKFTIIVLLVLLIGGSAAAYFMWNKPHRNVLNEKGLELSASQIVKEFQDNEATANTKFLDKAIQVTGIVTEVKSNQEGNTTVLLASDDPFTGVLCTFKQKEDGLTSGTSATIKGICSGMLSDVRLSEAVVVK
jgi:hypothetical protein